VKKSITAKRKTIARLKAQREQDEREMAEIKEINQWLQTEILPGMNALLPDLTLFFNDSIEPSTEAFQKKYPDPDDQRYYLNKFARYEHYLDQITDRVANASDNYRNRFLKVGVQLWGEEATEYLASEINRKRGK
jgi:chromosome condensin MukBEF ATPase and DNA-binding subunit MukB